MALTPEVYTISVYNFLEIFKRISLFQVDIWQTRDTVTHTDKQLQWRLIAEIFLALHQKCLM